MPCISQYRRYKGRTIIAKTFKLLTALIRCNWRSHVQRGSCVGESVKRFYVSYIYLPYQPCDSTRLLWKIRDLQIQLQSTNTFLASHNSCSGLFYLKAWQMSDFVFLSIKSLLKVYLKVYLKVGLNCLSFSSKIHWNFSVT